MSKQGLWWNFSTSIKIFFILNYFHIYYYYLKWECKANLPHGTKFGEIKVRCEGFESSIDSYHLAGSCGVIWKNLF